MKSIDITELFSEIEKNWAADAGQQEALEAMSKRVQEAILPMAIAVGTYYAVLTASMPETMAAELSKAFAHDLFRLHE